MAINYNSRLGFSLREHCDYAQLTKIADMYMPASTCNAPKVRSELEKFIKCDCPDVNYVKNRDNSKHDGRYNPYSGGPDPKLPYYTLEECCEELEDLILHLQNCNAPESTIKIQKHAQKALCQLQKFKTSKYYPQLKEFVDKEGKMALKELQTNTNE